MNTKNDSPEDRARVSQKIGPIVIDFFRDRIATQQCEFHADTLRRYVDENVPSYVAPNSPYRIMRALKEEGRIDYELIDRRRSLYRVVAVDSTQAPLPPPPPPPPPPLPKFFKQTSLNIEDLL